MSERWGFSIFKRDGFLKNVDAHGFMGRNEVGT